MKLYLNDTIQKPAKRRFESLEVGQVFVDECAYCMKIIPKEDAFGDFLNAVVLSGINLGLCLAYDREDLVIPVEAELNVIKYE